MLLSIGNESTSACHLILLFLAQVISVDPNFQVVINCKNPTPYCPPCKENTPLQELSSAQLSLSSPPVGVNLYIDHKSKKFHLPILHLYWLVYPNSHHSFPPSILPQQVHYSPRHICISPETYSIVSCLHTAPCEKSMSTSSQHNVSVLLESLLPLNNPSNHNLYSMFCNILNSSHLLNITKKNRKWIKDWFSKGVRRIWYGRTRVVITPKVNGWNGKKEVKTYHNLRS